LFGVLTLFATLGITVQTPAQTKQGQIITFNAPHAGPGSGQGIVPTSINPAGTITGYHVDASYMYHGFVRDKDETITTFEAPGAGPIGTFPPNINSSGEITGIWTTGVLHNTVLHGFLRDADGIITEFDTPDAGFNLTAPTGINPSGEVTGRCRDAHFMFHGFVPAADGTFTTFDAPNADINGTAPKASTQMGRSRETTKTRTSGATASCAIKMEPSLRIRVPAGSRDSCC
jgi:hypothetical protein